MKRRFPTLAVVAVFVVTLGCGQATPPEVAEVEVDEVEVDEAPPATVLDGTTWHAVTVTGQPSAEGVTSTIAFGADGQVNGNAGCNDYFGSFGVDGEAIAFGHIGATQKMCINEENMVQEGQFLEALNTAERYAIEDGVLVIHSTGHDEPTRLVPAQPAGVVTGSVFYRERIALPPDAKITVKLVDVSRMDVPATVLAEQVIEPETSVPVEFALEYDPATIDDRMSYAVQARIESGGQLMFTTTEHIPVITRGGPTEDVRVLVHRAQ